ncbi:patatin-like phospholipase family protein [Nannocystis sp. SCPEA4]|uniref:patatin-like phospholipase family protein n=1 Tax=Nannocystis sp. SCPEA4 TaxID=2996787 RepID=UPI0022721002|nr:patatin-like phospholipase family protein [Nannocystis sp. SCPEA4]MCY1058985.1 patatin-like phospholipase family protein [Nannocystis sp. SCPEA4]
MFTILSFVGGGIRGLMSATILQRLAKVRGGVVLQNTDMFAGCSTGSIITSELLAGKSPAQVIALFKGGEISFYDKMNADPSKPAYPIDEVLASQTLLHGDKKVADAGRNVLFVSFNVGGLETRADGLVVPKPWDSLMFTNMLDTEQDKLDGLDGHADTTIAVAAASSGAMPGQLGSLEGNVDGAFFNHDPTLAAISLAVRNGHALENIVAITIGTGLMPDWVATDTHEWGAHQWMYGAGNPFDNTPPFLMNQSRPSPVLDMCLSGTSAETMPRLAKMLLGDRYVNLNPRLPCFIPENATNPQALALLERHGAMVNIDKAIELIEKYWPDYQRAPVSRSAAKAGPAAAKRAVAPPGDGEFFYIKRYGSDDVLDVFQDNNLPGTRVIAYPRKQSGLNQQWQFIPAVEEPGWWYIQTAMDSKLVLTLQDSTLPSPPIVMEPMDPALKQRQLWNLVSTPELGWWFIQSKGQSLEVDTTNPNSFTPTVIGAAAEGDTKDAVGVALDYLAFEPMAWGFVRLSDAQRQSGTAPRSAASGREPRRF